MYFLSLSLSAPLDRASLLVPTYLPEIFLKFPGITNQSFFWTGKREPDLVLILQNVTLKSMLQHLSPDRSSPLVFSTGRNHCNLGKDEIHLCRGRGQWKIHELWVRRTSCRCQLCSLHIFMILSNSLELSQLHFQHLLIGVVWRIQKTIPL